MIRWMLLGALALGWPVLSPAISILAPDDRALDPLEMKSQVIEVEIDGPAARTRVTQVFHNQHRRDLEGWFLFPVPPGAQVTDFTMVINGETVHAAVLEKDEARRIYTDIVRRMQDPGLLEYLDGQTFRVRVFPIPAEGDMPIELSFAQPLEREGGLLAYRFATGRGKRTIRAAETDLTLRIRADQAIGPVYSPTHEIDVKRDGQTAKVIVADYRPEDGRGFELLYGPEGDGLGLHMVASRRQGDESGAFMLLLHPPMEGNMAKPVPKTVTFVFDTSGSMTNSGKIDGAKEALVQCLGALGPEDSFNILTFSTTVEFFRDAPLAATDENLRLAREFIAEIRARGGTNIDAALARALAQETGDNRLHQVVFMTDGLPTVGVTAPAMILKQVAENNAAGLRIFALGVGWDVNASLLDQIADETRSITAYIKPGEKIEARVATFFDSVAYPVLTGVGLDIPGVDAFDVYPVELPDIFRGRDLLVFGRYRGAGPSAVRITGRVGDREYDEVFETTFPEATPKDGPPIEALWANRKVGYLLDEIRRNGESKELRDEVIALAEEHNLVTPYTSYLVADDSELDRRIPPPALAGRPDPMGAPITWRSRPPTESRGRRLGVDMIPNSIPDSGPPPAAMRPNVPSSDSGEAAVRYSEMLREKKEATVADGVSWSQKIQSFSGKTFDNTDGVWVERTDFSGQDEVRVKYLSDAYFALLDKFPDRKDAILAGERVTLSLAGFKVVIGDEGIEKAGDLPKGLAPDTG